MAGRWLCAQCLGPGEPDKVTALDPRYTTGRCATGKHKGTQRLVREDVMFSPKPKKAKVQQLPLPATTGMVSRERQPDDAIPEPEPLPGLDPLHPLAKPTDWSDTG